MGKRKTTIQDPRKLRIGDRVLVGSWPWGQESMALTSGELMRRPGTVEEITRHWIRIRFDHGGYCECWQMRELYFALNDLPAPLTYNPGASWSATDRRTIAMARWRRAGGV